MECDSVQRQGAGPGRFWSARLPLQGMRRFTGSGDPALLFAGSQEVRDCAGYVGRIPRWRCDRFGAITVCLVVVATACSGAASRSARARAPRTSAPAYGLTRAVPASIRSACAQLAREEASQRIRRVVYCPPLVPSARPQVIQSVAAADGNSVSLRHLRTGYLVSVFSPTLGVRDGSGHWTFATGEGDVLRLWVYPPAPLVPRGQRRLQPLKPRVTHARLAGHLVTIYRMPLHGQGDGGLYDAHVVVQWQLDNTTYQVSAHGYENQPRAKAMAAALIREIERCAKTSTQSASDRGCRLAFRPRVH